MVNGIGGYQNAVSGYYGNDVSKSKATKDSARVKETGSATEATKTNESKLSQKAQDFLKNLREANEDMDFFVGDTEDDVQGALAASNKEFSVVFSADELEQMANDEDVANEKLNTIRHAMDMSRDISEQYNFDGNGITAKIGISFNEDGTANIFAELEKVGEKQKERIEKQREARAEEKKEADAKKSEGNDRTKLDRYGRQDEGMVKRTTLTATDEDDLIEQLQSLDWSKIEATKPYEAGGRIDFAV